MAEKTTSAGKLYEILSKAYSMPHNETTIKVWSGVLKAEATSQLSVTRKLGELIALFDDVRRDCYFLDDHPCQMTLNSLSNIQQPIINYGLSTKTWNDIKSRINQADINLIKMCDALLISKGVCQNLLGEDKVGELLEQVNDLINEFRTSNNLPDELKSELIRELVKIKTALYDFDIAGEANLQRVCHEVNSSLITKANIKPIQYKKYSDKVWEVFNKSAIILTLITGCDYLSGKYQLNLPIQTISPVETIRDEASEQPLLKSALDPQEMGATIDESVNHKVLSPSGEEEE